MAAAEHLAPPAPGHVCCPAPSVYGSPATCTLRLSFDTVKWRCQGSYQLSSSESVSSKRSGRAVYFCRENFRHRMSPTSFRWCSTWGQRQSLRATPCLSDSVRERTVGDVCVCAPGPALLWCVLQTDRSELGPLWWVWLESRRPPRQFSSPAFLERKPWSVTKN